MPSKNSTVSDIQQLQTDLDSLLDWSHRNHLSFNVSSFVFMTFHRKFNSEYINGHSPSQSISCKDLGGILTSTLSWRQCHDMITSKPYKFLGFLCRVFKNSHCTQTRKFLYMSIVRTNYNLLHCSSLWKPYSYLLKDTYDSLERAQRHATKFILSDYTSDY